MVCSVRKVPDPGSPVTFRLSFLSLIVITGASSRVLVVVVSASIEIENLDKKFLHLPPLKITREERDSLGKGTRGDEDDNDNEFLLITFQQSTPFILTLNSRRKPSVPLDFEPHNFISFSF
jgi:hypothetical protein